VRNLVVDDAVRSSLTAAFVAFKKIKPTDVTGTQPGSVYYAYDPATSRYWALAWFLPSATASETVQVGFQDGGSMGLFTKTGTGTWQVSTGGMPGACVELSYFPKAVLTAWALPGPLPQGMKC
jgi:hypothetical protein